MVKYIRELTPDEKREFSQMGKKAQEWHNPYHADKLADSLEAMIKEGRVSPESLDMVEGAITRLRAKSEEIKRYVRKTWGYVYDPRCRWFRDPKTGRFVRVRPEEHFVA